MTLLQVGLARNAVRHQRTSVQAQAGTGGGAALPLALLALSVVLVCILAGVAGKIAHSNRSSPGSKREAQSRARSDRASSSSRESAKLYSGHRQRSKAEAAEHVDPFLADETLERLSTQRDHRRGSTERRDSNSPSYSPRLLGRTSQKLAAPRVEKDRRPSYGMPSTPQDRLSSYGMPNGADNAIEEPSADFCEDLVVPPGCECLLVVPVRPIGRDGSFSISDDNGVPVLRASPASGGDGPGKAYDKILPTVPPCSALSMRPSQPRRTGDKFAFTPYGGSLTPTGGRAPHSTSQVPLTPGLSCLQLMAADGTALAQCRAERRARGAATEFHLLRADGAYFGTLVSDENKDRYTLSTQTDTTLYFWGSFEDHAVNITDEAGALLATTEPCGHTEFDSSSEYFRLRVAPGADVGLVVCSLLCIDHLGGAQG